MTAETDNPLLSIALVDDSEKDHSYLEAFLQTIARWNLPAMQFVDIVLISQRQSSDKAREICSGLPFKVQIVDAGHDFVGPKCVWDVLAGLRMAWPLMRGRYFTLCHTEFIWCHDRLWNTCNWLDQADPYVALGNLRRPGNKGENRANWKPGSCNKGLSQKLYNLIKEKQWVEAALEAELIPTLHWPIWQISEPAPGKAKWSEDLFFINRAWFEAWDGLNHGGQQPFQDIWDLIGAALNQMRKYKLCPRIVRMPRDVNQVIHLWHPKGYESFTPAVKDWFMSDAERWAETRFVDPIMWGRLFDMVAGKAKNQQAKFDLRRGPAGTVTRYAVDVSAFMQNGGRTRLESFYKDCGEEISDEQHAGDSTRHLKDKPANSYAI